MRCAHGSDFAAMDFATRNLYRTAIEQLARGSGSRGAGGRRRSACRPPAARRDMNGAREPAAIPAITSSPRAGRAFETAHRRSAPLRPCAYGALAASAGARAATSARAPARPQLLLGLPLLWASHSVGLAGWHGAILTLLGRSARDRMLRWRWSTGRSPAGFGAMPCCPASSSRRRPRELRTLVVVPTLLTEPRPRSMEQVERLEVHLSRRRRRRSALRAAVGLDGRRPAKRGRRDDAALLARRRRRHRRSESAPWPGAGRRTGSSCCIAGASGIAGERSWMGWERKRGKLHELNRLLRGATDTTFMPIEGSRRGRRPECPLRHHPRCRHAPAARRGAAADRQDGASAQPAAVSTRAGSRVVEGYAILQPRVTPSLPVGREGSLLPARVFRPAAASIPMPAAVSDVYQDLFGEGSYAGKGIYDVDAFEAALHGRVPGQRDAQPRPVRRHLRARRPGRPTSRSSRTSRRATTWPPRASTAGCGATGSCCPGCSAA